VTVDQDASTAVQTPSVLRAPSTGERWSSGSTNRRILNAVGTVAMLGAAAKAATVVQELVVARRFGVSTELDAWYVALLIPVTLAAVIGASIGEALVPVQARLRSQQDDAGAEALGRAVSRSALAVLAVVAGAVALAAPHVARLAGPGFDPETSRLAGRLLGVSALVVPLGGMALVSGKILNSRGRFATPAIAAGAVPVAVAVGVLTAPQRSAITLTVAAVIGYLAQALVIRVAEGRRRGPVTDRTAGEVVHLRREVLHGALPLAAAFLVIGAAPLIDDVMASRLGGGSVAALHLGNRLVAFAIAIGALAIGTAVAPYFGEQVARGDLAGLRRTVRTWRRLILAVTVPLTLVLVLGSHEIVHLFFERGAFGAGDTTAVSRVQAMSLLQIPPYMVSALYIRVLAALGTSRDFLVVALGAMVLNAALDAVLGAWLGVAGIGLATAIVYLVTAGLLGGRVRTAIDRRTVRAEPVDQA
jgi:putative peptidoglycan lipid II flippase